MEALITKLNEAYNDYFDQKISDEPKAMRHELESLIRQYQKEIIPWTVHKFKFKNVRSKFNLYKPRWDKGLQERQKRGDGI